MSLVEFDLVSLSFDHNNILLLVFVEVHLLQNIYRIFFLFRLQKHPTSNGAVQ